MISFARCNNAIDTSERHLPARQLTAVSATGRQGDAGGPLACRSADGSYVLAGVAAWSVGCSRHGVPSVYTGVSRTLSFTAHYITGAEYHPHYRSNGGVTRYY